VPEQVGDNLRWFFSRNFEIPAPYLEDGRWIPLFARYLLLSDTAVQMSVLMLLVSLFWFIAKSSIDKRSIGPYLQSFFWILLFAGLSIVIWGSFTVVERYAWPYFLMPGLLTLVLMITFVKVNNRRLMALAAVAALGFGVVMTITPRLRAVIPDLGQSESIRFLNLSFGNNSVGNPFGIPSSPKFEYKQVELLSGEKVDTPLDGASCGTGEVLCIYDQDIPELRIGAFGPGKKFMYISVTG
jgi:vacuolar-type H+-ATPase subunit I/STV1